MMVESKMKKTFQPFQPLLPHYHNQHYHYHRSQHNSFYHHKQYFHCHPSYHYNINNQQSSRDTYPCSRIIPNLFLPLWWNTSPLPLPLSLPSHPPLASPLVSQEIFQANNSVVEQFLDWRLIGGDWAMRGEVLPGGGVDLGVILQGSSGGEGGGGGPVRKVGFRLSLLHSVRCLSLFQFMPTDICLSLFSHNLFLTCQ